MGYFNHYTQQLQELDETSLPEGNRRLSVLDSTSSRWPVLFVFTHALYIVLAVVSMVGIQIVTKKLKVLGEEPFYESELRLTDITSNSKTTFHCQSKDDEKIISRQIISRKFKVNGIMILKWKVESVSKSTPSQSILLQKRVCLHQLFLTINHWPAFCNWEKENQRIWHVADYGKMKFIGSR